MIRAAILALSFTFAAAAIPGVARAQVETIIVTARVLTPPQQALYQKLDVRLTLAGKVFVKQEAKRLHEGTIAVETVLSDATRNCGAAFVNRTGEDDKSLAFLVLGKSLFLFDPLEVSHFYEGVPKSVLDRASAKAEPLIEKGDMEGANLLWLAALPPDRRALLMRMKQRNEKIRVTLSQLANELKP